MGLVTGLLTLPLAPVRGVAWVAEQVQRQAEAELNDPAVLRRELDKVEEAYEAGELSEEERDALQEQLIGRILQTRQAKRREA